MALSLTGCINFLNLPNINPTNVVTFGAARQGKSEYTLLTKSRRTYVCCVCHILALVNNLSPHLDNWWEGRWLGLIFQWGTYWPLMCWPCLLWYLWQTMILLCSLRICLDQNEINNASFLIPAIFIKLLGWLSCCFRWFFHEFVAHCIRWSYCLAQSAVTDPNPMPGHRQMRSSIEWCMLLHTSHFRQAPCVSCCFSWVICVCSS